MKNCNYQMSQASSFFHAKKETMAFEEDVISFSSSVITIKEEGEHRPASSSSARPVLRLASSSLDRPRCQSAFSSTARAHSLPRPPPAGHFVVLVAMTIIIIMMMKIMIIQIIIIIMIMVIIMATLPGTPCFWT